MLGLYDIAVYDTWRYDMLCYMMCLIICYEMLWCGL